MRRTHCCSSHPTAWASRPAARRSGTGSCSACCAATDSCRSRSSRSGTEPRVRLVDYLDKGATLGPDAPCLTTDGETRTYAEVQQLSRQVAAALARQGITAGDTVAILSANDPVAFTTVFGISRLGAVWCPINPRNEAAENRELLDLFECRALVFQASYADLVAKIRADLPRLTTLVCLDREVDFAL